MAIEDSSQTTGSRYLGEGFRLEPVFQPAREGATPIEATSFQHGTAVAQGASFQQGTAQPVIGTIDVDPTVTMVRRVPPPNLDYVFDDPDEGEPGRDRMLVHGLWELLLVVALAGVGYLLYRQQSSAFSGDGFRGLLLGAATLGALAAASAVALRAGTPNLAVGAVAIAAALYFGQNSNGGLLQPVLVVIGACAAIGLVQGLVVIGLHVPGWAASIGIGMVVLIWSTRQAAVSTTDLYDALPHAYYWFGGFCAASLVGGLASLVPSVRRAFGRFRPVADPARRRGYAAALITLVATIISSIMAGLGGVLAVSVTGTATPSNGLELTALALGAALLGGTSVFGRRGGIFGTIFAVGLLTVAVEYAEATDRSWPQAAVASVAIGIGLAVTRLVERFGRPNTGYEDSDEEAWVSRTHALTGSGESWQPSSVPTPTTAGGLWASDEAWGSTDRRLS